MAKRNQTKARTKRFRVRLPRDYAWKVMTAAYKVVQPSLLPWDRLVFSQTVKSRDWQAIDHLGESWSLQSMGSYCQSDSINAIQRWSAMIMLGGLVRKYSDGGDSDMLRDNAIAKFTEAEDMCIKTNRVLNRTDKFDPYDLSLMRRFISKTIGNILPPFHQLTRAARHGPGSSSSTERHQTAAYYKYCSWPYHCTTASIPYVKQLIESDPRWLGALEASYREKYQIPPWAILDWSAFWGIMFTPVDVNRITTVPKDRSTDRPIAIEPTLSLMLQLGVDGFIRRRLKRWGINLDSQEKNQRLAFTGSITDNDSMSPVTIDLASASDTISLRLCKTILPLPWYQYLLSIRSPYGDLPDGKRITYRKISSMGNGATFALESLVFASVVYASCFSILGYYPREEVGVYGDDLIVPKCVSLKLLHLLNTCGFAINQRKSFLSSPARESCGADWFAGYNVRGVFIKKTPKFVDEVLCDRNRLNRWFRTHGYLETAHIDKLYRKWIPHWLKHIVGPCSDEDFSSAWHTNRPLDPTDPSGSVLTTRVTSRIVPIPATSDFGLGRLVLNLKGGPTVVQPYDTRSANGGRADELPGYRVVRDVITGICYDWHITYTTAGYPFPALVT